MSLLRTIQSLLEADAPEADAPAQEKKLVKQIANELLTPMEERTRYVLYIDKPTLSQKYLKTGGGAEVVDDLTDDQLKEIASKSENAVLKRFAAPFKASQLINHPTGLDRAVIINAPSQQDSNLTTALERYKANPSNKAALVAAMKTIMSHANYGMTLDTNKAKPIAAALDEATPETLENVFDPYVLENYPVKSTFVGAKNEWYDATKAKDEPTKEEPDDLKDAETKLGNASTPGGVPEVKPEVAGSDDDVAITLDEPAEKKELTDTELHDQMEGLWSEWEGSGKKLTAETRSKMFKLLAKIKDNIKNL